LAMTGDRCDICNHSLWNHHHFRVKWVQVIDKQVSVDQDMKKKWETAKGGKEKTAALIAASKKALHGFNQVIDNATNDLAQLAGDYAGMSLSGSFSAQTEKTVRLLEQSYQGMQEKGVGQDQLQKIKESLGHMKEKLELLRDLSLRDAKEKARKESVGVGSIVKNLFGRW
jgi:hypothetical protein